MKTLITTILALMLSIGVWANGATPDFSKLILNEIDGEATFVEIFNSGTEPINLEGVRLQRNQGPNAPSPQPAGSEWVGTAADVIPAGAYRLILFVGNGAIDGSGHTLYGNSAFVGWTVSSGLSNQQTLKIELICPEGFSIDAFIRGNGHEQLPNWGTAGAARRPNDTRPSYSRMPNGSWAYALPTPGAENGARTFDIVNPGYLRSMLVLNEISGENVFVEIFNVGRHAVSMENIRLQRNEGPNAPSPQPAGSEWVGTSTDEIPAGEYRLFAFRGGAGTNAVPTIVSESPAYVGWDISSGLSDQQILKIAIINAHGNSVSQFIRGDEPLPNWGTTGQARRPDGNQDRSFSRMNDGTWAWAVQSPGAVNTAATHPIINAGYIIYFSMEVPTELVITNVGHTPITPTQSDDIIVTATITYTTSPVADVWIEWTLDGVAGQVVIDMVEGADNVWTGTISAQAVGAVVTYGVFAENELGETTESDWSGFTVIDAGGIIVAGSPDALANELLILTAFGTGPTNAEASNRSFVELYNTTTAPINLDGITLFWANGIRGPAVTADEEWQGVALTGTIPAEGSFLVLGPIRRGAATSGLIIEENTYGDMFVEDMILDNRAFKVALIRNTGTLLAPNPFDMDGAGAFAAGYIDMVGSANAIDHATNPDNIFGYEGAPTRNSGSSAVRRSSLVDTDNNYEDFEEKRFADLSADELAARRPRTSAAGAWDPFAALTALTISSVEHSPTPVTTEDAVTVSATVTAPGGVEIYTVYLEWVLNASDIDTTRVEMTLENDVWTAEISAQAEGAVVTYRVLATSDLDETVASSWRSFTVAVPTQLVITNVSHYPTEPTADDGPVTVSATVTYTTSNVASVVIEWTHITGPVSVPMPVVTMTLGENNVWTGEFPVIAAGTRVTYVVAATNALGEVTRSAEDEFIIAGGANIAVVAENNSISIFPNPVRDILTVTVADFAPGMIFNLFDVNGRMVQTGPLAETTTIDMTNLRAGTYVLTIVQNGAQVATFRVVKQ